MNVTLREAPESKPYQIFDEVGDADLTQEHCDIVAEIYQSICLFKVYSKELEFKLQRALQAKFPNVSKFNLIYSIESQSATLEFGNVIATIEPGLIT